MRKTRVLSVSLFNPTDETDPDERVRTNLENILTLLDEAAVYDPDFVCFPELTLQHAASEMLPEIARPIPGPETAAVAEKARELNSYVILPLYERDGDTVYNAAAFIGPDGDHRGTYRKVAPTHGEVRGGITPGSEVPVWETEFGRIGMQICWDTRFPEIGRTLGAKGANLVFFPTHGTTHDRMRTMAQYNGYHIVLTDKNDTRMFTPRREVHGRIGDEWKNPETEDLDLNGGQAWLSFVELNTDIASYSMASDTVWTWPRAIQKAYGGSVSLDILQDDGIFVLEALDGISIADLEAEFELVGTRAYEEETRRVVHESIDDSPLDRIVDDK